MEVPAPLTFKTPEIVVEPLVVSTVNTELEAAFKTRKAWVELIKVWKVTRVEVP